MQLAGRTVAIFARGVLGPTGDRYDDRMTKRLTASEAKAIFLQLVDEATQGAEFEITKHGRTAARLVPPKGPHGLRGALTGIAMSAADEDDLFTTGVAWELG